jgi:hypothetical protein
MVMGSILIVRNEIASENRKRKSDFCAMGEDFGIVL